ncbi:MAG TPA: 2-amino-4-hydroxy-6-hydroxymethyldihydropteridine diphosphokinase [Rubrobacteraceae bacterium]|nr:2-amino-4-hydroxy-6-hydroxymethyldihydropteridine diphosphokinase [Rubrobacteraceae bacterium]
MSRAFLSFGSNLGDRLYYLRSAVSALRFAPSVEVLNVSRVYETEPVEVEEAQPEYLNCVVEAECGLPAVELLRFCQGVEAGLGRVRKGEKAPRTVDIDVLLFGEEVVEGRELALPHRGILRAFNLRGLADLDPSVYIPGRGMVGDLLAEADLSGVREYGEGV